MRVFVAGATGAVGRPLIPLLVEEGHEVTGMTRSPGSAEAIRSVGADAAVGDGLDREGVITAVREARPDVVIHQMTALSGKLSLRRFDQSFALTNRLRTKGTDHLIAAAQEVGARRFVAHSFGGWTYERRGSLVKTEDDPLDPDPPKAARRSLGAIRHLESAATGADGLDGVVLRFGFFYGPGTTMNEGGPQVNAIRARQLPVVGNGAGIWSFTHIEDAALATAAAATEQAPPGTYNVVDDEPAPASEWIPALAEAVNAKPPRHVPTWLARMLIGEQGASFMTAIRGASNAKAKRDLAWQPRWPSWREGFRSGLGSTTA
jgi:2-alkyl-3-oxoalkanoate reductase